MKPFKKAWVLGLALAASVVFGISAAQTATFTVCASGCDHTSIQAAVTAASSGDVITVAAGTYTEQVVIDKSVTLTGAGSGTTIIQAPAVLANDPDGGKTVVEFTGALLSAELSGFTVQGPVNGLNFGIYVRAGAFANVHDNVIRNIRDDPFSGNQTGVAIEVGKYNDTAPFVNQTGTATVTNVTIYGYQKTGIAVERAGSSATITGNTITGAGPTTITAQNGIQIRRGATGTIRANTITGNAWDGPTWSAEGIGVLHAGSGVIVQGNTVNHNSANIYVWKSDGVQILDNLVSDSSPVDQNASAGITVQSSGTPSCCGGSPGNFIVGLTISGNTIQNNLSGGTTQSDGIDLYAVNGATVSNNIITGSGYDGILVGASGNIAFTGNTFSQNGNGVTSRLSDHSTDPHAAAIDFGGLQGFAPGAWNGDANTLGGFTVHSNTFTGNRNAIWNYDSGAVDATNNWFGIAAGPGSLTNITTTPWATDSGFTTLSNNANLTALSLSSGTLSPAFSPSTTAYSASVDNGTTSVTVIKFTNPGANAVVTGGSILSVGNNTVSITVTSADGTASKSYSVTVNRAAPVVDRCPNLGGVQLEVPSGHELVNGQCVLKPNAPVSAPAVPDKPGAVTVVVQPPTGMGTTPPPVTVTTKWDPGTFTVPVNVTVTPQVPTPVPAGTTPPPPTPVAGGFTVGSTTVQLTVTDASGAKVTSFQAPIVIHVSASQAGDVPAYSQDGVIWVIIPRLSSPELPAGQQDGYYRNSDGSIDIYTRHATLFGLLKDTQAPTAPKLKIRVEKAGLRLSWSNTRDNIKIAGYVVSKDGHGYKASKQPHDVILLLKAGTYAVRARDAAGNVSKASAAVKVVRRGQHFVIVKS